MHTGENAGELLDWSRPDCTNIDILLLTVHNDELAKSRSVIYLHICTTPIAKAYLSGLAISGYLGVAEMIFGLSSAAI